MKIGVRMPSIKKSIKARTTGKINRMLKGSINPFYGKKGIGYITNPKKAIYNKIYNKTSISAKKLLSQTNKKAEENIDIVNDEETVVLFEYSPNMIKYSISLFFLLISIILYIKTLLIVPYSQILKPFLNIIAYLFTFSVFLFLFNYREINICNYIIKRIILFIPEVSMVLTYLCIFGVFGADYMFSYLFLTLMSAVSIHIFLK